MTVLYVIFLLLVFAMGVALMAVFCRKSADLFACGLVLVLCSLFLFNELYKGSTPFKKGRGLLQVTYQDGIPIDSTYIFK